jgi:hypothetical protein
VVLVEAFRMGFSVVYGIAGALGISLQNMAASPLPGRLYCNTLCMTRGWPRPCMRKEEWLNRVYSSPCQEGAVNFFTGA